MTYQPVRSQARTGPFVYKPTWVANAFIQRAREEGVPLDPLKLQKLVYCLHGWHLATRDAPAVGELFEAWPAGPVLSSLYQKFKKYRWRSIAEFASDIDPETGESKALTVPSTQRVPQPRFDRPPPPPARRAGEALAGIAPGYYML